MIPAANGIITITTDFGFQDSFVGIMKGVLLRLNQTATPIEITQTIPPHDIASASFLTGVTYGSFPPGTVHLIVVDPGVGGERRPLAVSVEAHTFVAPDNGVLSDVLLAESDCAAVALSDPGYFSDSPSNTFHGRDIFAPAAAYLSRGVSLSELGPPAFDLVVLPITAPEATGHTIRGCVRYVDGFGNVMTNVSESLFHQSQDDRAFRVYIKNYVIDRLQTAYSDVRVGEPLAVFNSFDLMEIAVNQGDAAEQLGAQVGDSIRIEFAP